ncbi:hypothetical protein G6F57_000618 [Rhizopus arrhizus]|nr:hypothetical protein G6F30_001173 [Rhizopus arrhizus]KAG1420255.1 hypothetical protein G6F58_004266 [Rhizopus delemar]KAG0989076.1 hypothetical protein G6F29_001257 [Rhizopus arrhizus]KAG0999812.1 hypothetical protein G6F28_000648 [Rhizopus arrhizus]KAG1014238.1 hypothetical protein G6F27_001149 [Rhizopus arrhizus]
MLQEKYIGLILAMSSSIFIGLSFVITKKGLVSSKRRHGLSAEHGHISYLRNWTWWIGIGTMAVGEILNFSAYSFAPAILVTPLGALSIITGTLFASIFLKERLSITVLHAPEDKEVTLIDELIYYALQPVGSISVMSIKAFGIALKLTLSGNNQFTHTSTYAFGFTVVICIMVQMNYFNKALELFPTSVVNPIYFVCFTTATIVASAILFQGFNTDNPVNIASLLCGFIIIFIGIYFLNSTTKNHDMDESERILIDDSDDEDDEEDVLFSQESDLYSLSGLNDEVISPRSR